MGRNVTDSDHNIGIIRQPQREVCPMTITVGVSESQAGLVHFFSLVYAL